MSVDVDRAVYSRLADDDDLAELIALYVQEIPQRIEQLKKAWTGGDRRALRRLAHQLKGSSGSYGFDAVTSFALELEQSILQDRPVLEVQRALADLADICLRLRAGTPPK